MLTQLTLSASPLSPAPTPDVDTPLADDSETEMQLATAADPFVPADVTLLTLTRIKAEEETTVTIETDIQVKIKADIKVNSKKTIKASVRATRVLALDQAWAKPEKGGARVPTVIPEAAATLMAAYRQADAAKALSTLATPAPAPPRQDLVADASEVVEDISTPDPAPAASPEDTPGLSADNESHATISEAFILLVDESQVGIGQGRFVSGKRLLESRVGFVQMMIGGQC